MQERKREKGQHPAVKGAKMAAWLLSLCCAALCCASASLSRKKREEEGLDEKESKRFLPFFPFLPLSLPPRQDFLLVSLLQYIQRGGAEGESRDLLLLVN